MWTNAYYRSTGNSNNTYSLQFIEGLKYSYVWPMYGKNPTIRTNTTLALCRHGPNLISHTDKNRKCRVRLYEGAASNYTWLIRGLRLSCNRRSFLVFCSELRNKTLLRFSCAMTVAKFSFTLINVSSCPRSLSGDQFR